MRTLLPLIVLAASPLFAHVMSMSTGDITIQGTQAHYELQMPLYEIGDIKNPDTALFAQIHFSTAGRPARLVTHSCRADEASGNLLCSAEYEFPIPVDRLEVECTFHKITVPNHVHLLRAQKDGKSDQAVLDFSISKAQIRFDPPTLLETVTTQTRAGFLRAVGGLAQILFLATLALAARSRRELGALAGMFLIGQIAVALIVPKTTWDPAPRFVEAAAALTVAYMAVEILALPDAGKRWLIAGVLGAFHGLYFALFLRATGYQPTYVLTGAAVSELALIAIFAFGFSCIGRLVTGFKPVQVWGSLLLAVGMFWFLLRIRS